MAIKFTKEYERLKSEYDKYTQRRNEELTTIKNNLELVRQQIAKLTELIDKVPRTMTEEEYLKASADLKNAEEQKEFLQKRLASLEAQLPLTEEEQKEFRRALVKEHKQIMDEAEELMFKNLTPVLNKLEEPIARLKALEVLSKDARITILNEHGGNTAPMSKLLYELMCVGLSSYGEVAKQKKQPGFLLEGNSAFEQERKTIRRMSKRVVKNYPGSAEVNILLR